MSGTLKISFAPDMPDATVEIVAPDLTTVGRMWLRPGQQKSVDVPSEGSFLRVHFASGEIFTLEDPGNPDRVVSMSSLAEHRERRSPAGTEEMRPRSLGELKRIRYTEAFTKARSPVADESFTSLEGGITVQLLSSALIPSSGMVRENGVAVVFEPPRLETPYDLNLNAAGIQARVRIPGMVEELLLRSDEVGNGKRIVTVRVRTVNSVADTIGAYMNRGDLHSAAAMTDWSDRAEDLLKDKLRDPFGAMVAAYLLLRLRRFDLMRDWTRNLANWFPELSDGAVIRAWQQIHKRENEAEVRTYLRRALNAPLPVFSEGLQLLRDGARLLGTEANEALAKLNKQSGIVLWNSPFTVTIHGAGANESSFDLDVDYLSRI